MDGNNYNNNDDITIMIANNDDSQGDHKILIRSIVSVINIATCNLAKYPAKLLLSGRYTKVTQSLKMFEFELNTTKSYEYQ